jgi:hypothetical protein
MTKRNQNIKRDRFKNVAGRRVQKILDNMDSLSKCANRSNYDYEDADVNKMMRAIREKVKVLEASYNSNTKSTKNTFKF